MEAKDKLVEASRRAEDKIAEASMLVVEASRRAEDSQTKVADAKTEVANTQKLLSAAQIEITRVTTELSDKSGKLMHAEGCLSMRGVIGKYNVMLSILVC